MESFNEYDKYRFFSWKDFYTAWQQTIFGTMDITKLSIAAKQSMNDRLRSQIQSLWQSFNENRDKLRKDYATDKASIISYLAAFLLPNIERVFHLMTLPQAEKGIKKIFTPGKEEVVITDFGAGPLSATIGFLLAADYWQIDLSKVKITIMAVERSGVMLNAGYEMLKQGFGDRVDISMTNNSSSVKIPKLSDVILAANVFNELPIKHRVTTMESLWKGLAKNGFMLILEPGQDIHSKNLGSMRNLFLQNNFKETIVLAPCRQMVHCPLNSETSRNDWCWFSHRWQMPEVMMTIDKISGLEHRQLNYSYLLLCKSKPSKPKGGWLVLSDQLSAGKLDERSRFVYWLNKNVIDGDASSIAKLPAANIGKVLLCSPEGELQSLLGDKSLFGTLKRGEKLDELPKNLVLCKEKK